MRFSIAVLGALLTACQSHGAVTVLSNLTQGWLV